jgi:FOG: FHA domain
MVITKDVGEIDSYSKKMLEHQNIEGFLPFQSRSMDNNLLYYYDISSKQSMATLFEKTRVTYQAIKIICTEILKTIERAYDYLLPEHDFLLQVDYIYLEVSSFKPVLCFIPGYNYDIRKQMIAFLEYLMNKVDYNDKEAVFIVYRLYAISKEEGYTFDDLIKALQSDDVQYKFNKVGNCFNNNELIEEIDPPNLNSSLNQNSIQNYENDKSKFIKKSLDNKEISKEKKNQIIPTMLEKVEDEREILCYPVKTYLLTLTSILGGIGVFAVCLLSGVLYNTYGNRLDPIKLLSCLLILFCIESYVLKTLWNKSNKITKLVAKQEYIDPRQLISEDKRSFDKPSNQKEVVPRTTQPALEEVNPTCLLNSSMNQNLLNEDYANREYQNFIPILIPMDHNHYQPIKLDVIPFFVGKLKKNVDYCLENEAVSRYHAKIFQEEEKYYITDLNSRNGTFINEQVLMPYQQKELQFGDEIIFANIKYTFEISA